MTQPLTRPLNTENRLLRATGGMDIRVPFGASMVADPTMGQLLVTGMTATAAGVADVPFEEIERKQAEEQAWRFEMAQLSTSLESAMDDERDGIISQIEALEAEKKARADSLTKEAIAAGKLVAADALNEQYKDVGVTFDRATNADEARLVAENRKAQIIRNALIEKGPSGFIAGASRFGVNLLAMATDPLEVATMFIPIVGQAGKAAAVARFGRVGGRVGVGMIEGGVGNALTEPFYMGLSRAQQLDYTMSDALMNIGLGAVLGGGIGGAAGAFARAEPTVRADVPEPVQRVAVEKPLPFDDPRTWPVMDIQSRRAAEQRSVADVALRQFATGQAVDVSAVMPRLSARDALDKLNAEIATTRKYPLADAVMSEVKVHPQGRFAEELRAAGITNKTLPGLFSAKGARDFDNLVASEWDAKLPGIADKIGRDGDYLDPVGFARVLIDELTGREGAVRSKADVMAEIAEVEGDAQRMTDIFNSVKDAGMILRNEAEIRFVDDLLRRGEDIDFAMERVALRSDDMAADLAKHAEIEPLADVRASLALDKPIKPTFMEDDIADMEAMVRQYEGRMNADMLSDMEAFDLAEKAARSYAEVAEAAAICMART